jgi:hypothetical protein
LDDELGRIESEALVASLRLLSDIYVEGLRNPTKNSSEDKGPIARVSKRDLPISKRLGGLLHGTTIPKPRLQRRNENIDNLRVQSKDLKNAYPIISRFVQFTE